MIPTTTVEIKTSVEIGWMRQAGQIVAETLAILAEAARPGVTTAELDRVAREEILHRKATPAFLGYRGFPATLCTSINEEVVHGIPRSDRVLKEGDLLSLDLGAVVRGFYADAALTVMIGVVSERARRLVEVTRTALGKGIEQVRSDVRLGDIGHAVQACVQAERMSVVREFVGHGIGRALHEEPAVPNYGRAGTGKRLPFGTVIAIEPMVTLGGPGVKILKDGWTAVTVDGSLSAHFEHTVAITKDGGEVLTRA